MTDIDTHEDLGGVYGKLLAQLSEIDNTLDATKDQKTAGKRLIRKEMIEKFEDQWQNIAKQIIDRLNQFDTDEERLAFYWGIGNALSDSFNEKGETYLNQQIESRPVPEKLVLSDEEMKALTERRSTIYKHAKTVRELAMMFGGSENEFPVPKRRSGGSGVRGKRAISLYTWSINAVPFTESPPLVKLAEKYNYGTATALRKAIQDQLQLADLRDPPTPLNFNLPTGEVLTGIRPEGVEADTDDDDEDDDEDENENGSE